MAAQTNAKLDPNNYTRNTRDKLSSALENKEKSTSFPSKILEIDHWMCFRINEHKLMKKDDFEFTNDIHRIFLPLPIQLATSYNQSYSSSGLGPLGAAASKLGEGVVGSAVSALEGDAAGAIAKLKNSFDNINWEDAAIGAGATAVGTGAQIVGQFGIGGADVGKGFLAGGGISVNPYLAMVYESPSLRTHSFNWKLVAKNFSESQAIYKIIKLFKYHSSPEIGRNLAGSLLKYPQQFDVDFHHDDYLYNIGPSVLTAMEVNYHPDGILYHVQDPDSFEDDDTPSRPLKLPVAVQLSLTLQEVSIVTKSEINDYDR